MKNKIVLLFFIIFCISQANAQYYQTGQDPSQIKWRQINTINFQVIFPEEFEIQAQKLSHILEKVYDYADYSLKRHPKKISVILHSYTTNSNGLLAWAPKRIELFTTPNQQIYSQDWLEQLAIHEFRHLVQMDKIQSEIPLIIMALLGEQATAIITGMYLPFWFLEGDAVVTETALSNAGRGRSSSFSMEYRAQLAEKGKYSFDKAYLGSYKDYVTDHYKLGYWMVGKSREKFGAEIWSNALERIGSKPLSVTPLNSSLLTNTKQTTKLLYDNIFSGLQEEWKADRQSRSIDSVRIVSPRKQKYTNYLYPAVYHDSLIVSYRTSLDDIGRFVIVYPNQTEKVIYTPGNIFEESVSLTENLLIWSERRADVRWTHSDRSVIQVFNIDSKTIHEINSRNKLFSPVISPDLKSFAAVEVDQQNNYFLSIFDLNSGKTIIQYQTTGNQYFFTPTWDEKGERLFFVCLENKGKYLASFDIKDHKFSRLTQSTFANLKNPVYSNGLIYFSSDFSGIDNLYALNITNSQITEIVSVKFGADYPTISASGKQAYFSNYTANGYQVSAIKLNQNQTGKVISDLSLENNELASNLARQEKGVLTFDTMNTTQYKSQKYSKLRHLLNFHSWAPLYIDANSYEIKPGVSVFSQNKLGTAETRLGYEYNPNDKTGKYKLAFNYLGWYPEVYTSLTYGNEKSNYYLITKTLNQNNQVIKIDTTLQKLNWNELEANINIKLPLNLSKGRYTRGLHPEFGYTLVNPTKPDKNLSTLYPDGYQSLTYRLYYYNILAQSHQNLMPQWAQWIDLLYRHTPLGISDLGSLSGVQTELYFPGLFKNHGLKVYQGYQEKSVTGNSYNFSNFLRFPRGFYSYQNNRMYSMSVDYKFPVCYPDFSLGKLAYLKRIKTGLFHDYAWLSMPVKDNTGKIYPNSVTMTMQSVGIDLSSDLHLLRFFAPIELGLRTLYRPDYGDFQFNMLLSIDFNGF